jgi:prepilin-type N-terminal cleavage/methylation domain-containing protein
MYLARRRRNRSAFTFMELIIAIVILAVLATIAVVSFAALLSNSGTVRDATALTSFANDVRGDATSSGIAPNDAPVVSDITNSLGEMDKLSGDVTMTAVGSTYRGAAPSTTYGVVSYDLLDRPGLVGYAMETQNGDCAMDLTTGNTTVSWTYNYNIASSCDGVAALRGPAQTAPVAVTTTTMPTTTMPPESVVTELSIGSAPNSVTDDGVDTWIASLTGGTYGTGFITKIDDATETTTEIDSPSITNPYDVYSNGTYAWVTNNTGGTNGTGSMSKIDVDTGDVTALNDHSFDLPTELSSNGTDIWVGNQRGGTFGNGSVSELNIASGTITQINNAEFKDPSSVFTEGGNLWVANYFGGPSGNGSISELNESSGAVTEYDSNLFSEPTAVYTDGSTAWVTNRTGAVTEIDIATGDISEISDPSLSGSFAAASLNGVLWVANYGGGTGGTGSVSEINESTGAVTVLNSPTFAEPWAIAVHGSQLWVVNEWGAGTGSVSIVSP